MTIINNQPSLRPNDYPDYESTVGNSFASSFPDVDTVESRDIQKAEAVTGGLYKIYESVVDEAAKGAPMTARDSAIIANTVANMTATIGVESHVRTLVSLESLYEQQIGYQITIESLAKTIKDAFARLIAFIKQAISRCIRFIQESMQGLRDRSRIISTLFAKLDRNTSARGTVEFKPPYFYLAADNIIPGAPLSTYLDTTVFIDELYRENEKIAEFAISCIKKLMTMETDALPTRGEMLRTMRGSAPPLVAAGLSNQSRTSSAFVSWTKPLSANTVGVRRLPQGNVPLNSSTYSIMLVPIEKAHQCGVTTRYNDKPDYLKQGVPLQIREVQMTIPKIMQLWNKGQERGAGMVKLLNTLTVEYDKIPAYLDGIFGPDADDGYSPVPEDGPMHPWYIEDYAKEVYQLTVKAQQSVQSATELQTKMVEAVETLLRDFQMDPNELKTLEADKTNQKVSNA